LNQSVVCLKESSLSTFSLHLLIGGWLEFVPLKKHKKNKSFIKIQISFIIETGVGKMTPSGGGEPWGGDHSP